MEQRTICDYCGRTIRRGTKPAMLRYANGERRPMHKSCRHRVTAGDGCGCDLCTGDIH